MRCDGEAPRLTGEAPRLTADFEVVTPRPPVAPDRVEDSGLELTKVRRLDPDPGPALETHENEERDMSGAQPSIGVFVRGNVGWQAGLLRRQGSFGTRRHRAPPRFAAEGLRVSPSNHRVDTPPRRLMHCREEAAARTALPDGDIRSHAGIAAGRS